MTAPTPEERRFGLNPTRILRNGGLRGRPLERYFQRRLLWHRVYRAMSYVRSALWVAPLIALVVVLLLAPWVRRLDLWLDWKFTGLSLDGARALAETVVTLSLSFMVFTFGSLLVAIQVAGGQLTPRIIATMLLRDNVVRSSVGLFVFTLMFTVTALNRLDDRVNGLVAFLVATLGILCTAAFLFLIDYAARLLRPVTILARIGEQGLEVIDSVYPTSYAGASSADASSAHASTADGAPDIARGPATNVVRHVGRSGIVLAVDLETLVLKAQAANGIIEFLPQVGDFVGTGEPLFALYGGASTVRLDYLRATVAFGVERTLEQDPMFALRILVDIALKALSAAINDPTTAVLAIDQIQRFLGSVGGRPLRGEIITDATGDPRVIYRTPNWDHFVQVACTEIRACGARNVQVARRLRAMLDSLCASLPEHRHALLRDERDRLDQALQTLYDIPADLALASEPDAQGLGGSSARPRRVV